VSSGPRVPKWCRRPPTGLPKPPLSGPGIDLRPGGARILTHLHWRRDGAVTAERAMAGHSHWATIKRKKGAADAKRGRLFSKLAKAITVAASNGGGDPDANLRLRYAIDAARKENMPKDSIANAIKKGTGEGVDATDFKEGVYGGFGPGGVAIICEVLTDNTNRTTPEIRKLFEKSGGKFDDSGSTMYKFEQKGLITIKLDAIDEDGLMEIAAEAGAEDFRRDEEAGVWEVLVDPTEFMAVRKAFDEHPDLPIEDAQIARIPLADVDVDDKTQEKVVALLEQFDDHDDVTNVYTDANLKVS
jgi:YebC/PmpR family DNA-binding regulatory protein